MPQIITSRTRLRYLKRPSPPYALNWDSLQSRNLSGFWPLEGDSFTQELVQGRTTTPTTVTVDASDDFGAEVFGRVPYCRANGTQIAITPTLTLTAYTISFWARFNAWNNGSRPFVGDPGSGPYWEFDLSGNNAVKLSASSSSSSFGNPVTGLGEWHYYTIKRRPGNDGDTTDNLLYKDGVPNSSANRNNTDNAIFAYFLSTGFSGPDYAMTHLTIQGVYVEDAEVWNKYDPATRWDLYYPLHRRAWSFPASSPAGVAYDLSLSDSVVTPDSYSRLSDAVRSNSDSLSVSEIFSDTFDWGRSYSENLLLVDLYDRLSDALRDFTDPLSIFNPTTSTTRYTDLELPAETVSIPDTYSRVSDGVRSYTDDLLVPDDFARLVDALRLTTDDLALTDAYLRIADANRSDSDTVAASDTFDRLSDANRSESDSLSVTDAFSRVSDALRSISDLLVIVEELSTLLVGEGVFTILVAESLGILDVFDRLSDAARAYSDNVLVADEFGRASDYQRIFDDTGVVSDDYSRISDALRLATDFAAWQESFDRASDANRSESDDLGLRDLYSRMSDAARDYSDTAVVADDVQRQSDYLRQFDDTAVWSDLFDFRTTIDRLFADLLLVSDDVLIQSDFYRLMSENVAVQDTFDRLADALRNFEDVTSIEEEIALFLEIANLIRGPHWIEAMEAMAAGLGIGILGRRGVAQAYASGAEAFGATSSGPSVEEAGKG